MYKLVDIQDINDILHDELCFDFDPRRYYHILNKNILEDTSMLSIGVYDNNMNKVKITMIQEFLIDLKKRTEFTW